MNLQRPPDRYEQEDQAQVRSAVEAADRQNVKRGVPLTSFIMVSPNGSKFEATVSNAGAWVLTPL